MLLSYRDTSRLANLPWWLLEFRRPENAEIVLRRIIKSAAQSFKRNPVEIFLCRELPYEGWIFVRSTSAEAVGKIGAVHGLLSSKARAFLGKGDVIEVEDAEVQKLIAAARATHELASSKIKSGSFVRIRDGFTRDYCGCVEEIADNIATIHIRLFSRDFFVRTPIGNLADLSNIANGRKVFYCTACTTHAGGSNGRKPSETFGSECRGAQFELAGRSRDETENLARHTSAAHQERGDSRRQDFQARSHR